MKIYVESLCKTEAATKDDLYKRCSYKFRKIHRETPVSEFLF